MHFIQKYGFRHKSDHRTTTKELFDVKIQCLVETLCINICAKYQDNNCSGCRENQADSPNSGEPRIDETLYTSLLLLHH